VAVAAGGHDGNGFDEDDDFDSIEDLDIDNNYNEEDD
jgi:hypothetical protein